MGSPASHSMFRNFSFEKTIDEIQEAMGKKIAFLKDKVVDRQGRIAKLREEHGITDSDMIDLLTQAANLQVSNRPVGKMSYALGGQDDQDVRIIGAGVVAFLLDEKMLIEQEQASVKQLSRIVRNLRPVTCFGDNGETYIQDSFTLRDDELDFLGF